MSFISDSFFRLSMYLISEVYCIRRSSVYRFTSTKLDYLTWVFCISSKLSSCLHSVCTFVCDVTSLRPVTSCIYIRRHSHALSSVREKHFTFLFLFCSFFPSRAAFLYFFCFQDLDYVSRDLDFDVFFFFSEKLIPLFEKFAFTVYAPHEFCLPVDFSHDFCLQQNSLTYDIIHDIIVNCVRV